MTITVPCHQCGQKYSVDRQYAGKQIKCKQCGAVVTIPVPRGGVSQASGSAARSHPPTAKLVGDTTAETEQVRCPNCSGLCAIRPEWRGLQLECPSCKRRFLLPQRGAAGGAPAGASADAWMHGGLDDASRYEQDAGAASDWSGDRPKRQRKSGEFKVSPGLVIGLSVAAVAVVVIAVVVVAAVKLSRLFTVADLGPQQPFAMDAVAMPNFPVRGPARIMERGVQRYEIRLNGTPGAPGHFGKMWLYLPEGQTDPKSLPCVLIAPAGAMVFTGMNLAEEDTAEHVPYVRVGFAVLAYEIDGACPNAENASDAQTTRAINAFRASNAGLVNARIATEYVLTQVPQVDPAQLFAVGHSSAAQHALLFAAHEPRLKGCVAFAPVVDEVKWVGPAALATLSMASPGLRDFAARNSPKYHEERLNCPVLLFHALDDSNVPASESQQCAARLKQLGKDVTLVTVPTGNHYDSMIHHGIPTAISWLTKQGAAPKPPQQNVVAERPQPNPQLDELRRQQTEESNRRRAKVDAEIAAAREKIERGIQDSGPGWELARPLGKPAQVFTHFELGFRIDVPVFWEMSRAAESVPAINPPTGRQAVFGFAPEHPFGDGLGAIARVEIYPAKEDEKPATLLRGWERDARKRPGYKRGGSVEEYQFQNLPAARLVYTWQDRQNNGEFEINAVQRDSTIYVMTVACVNTLQRVHYADRLRDVIKSFELIPPQSSAKRNQTPDTPEPGK